MVCFMVPASTEGEIMEVISVNLIPGRRFPVVHIKQDDEDREIRLELVNGSVPYTLSGGESLKLRTRQSNGKAKTISVINTGDDYVDITISKEAVSVPGRVYCKLRIDDIGAEAFDIIVEPKP